ncbi:MAG: hypothetical protein AB2784_08300 [Candidatus Thiodiazotropha endolucinida]
MNMIEELLNIKEYCIPGVIGRLKWHLSECGRPCVGGVYAFWWIGSKKSFLQEIQNNELHYSGPSKRKITLKLNDSTVNSAKNGYVPLYIGKTSTPIAKRVGKHLMLGTERTISKEEAYGIANRKNTSCQVRDRLDRLFPDIEDTREIAINNIGLSYLKLEGDNNFSQRFFLEDLAIGTLQPIFNVDSER